MRYCVGGVKGTGWRSDGVVISVCRLDGHRKKVFVPLSDLKMCFSINANSPTPSKVSAYASFLATLVSVVMARSL